MNCNWNIYIKQFLVLVIKIGILKNRTRLTQCSRAAVRKQKKKKEKHIYNVARSEVRAGSEGSVTQMVNCSQKEITGQTD